MFEVKNLVFNKKNLMFSRVGSYLKRDVSTAVRFFAL